MALGSSPIGSSAIGGSAPGSSAPAPVIVSGVGISHGMATAAAVAPGAAVFATNRVEIIKEGDSAWTDITNDVALTDTEQFSTVMGCPDGGPNDRTATRGNFYFSLYNGPTNTDPSRPIGKYATNSSNCLTGFAAGIPVRWVQTYQGMDKVMWRGKLFTMTAVPGTRGPRVTRCVAFDIFNDLAETDIKQIDPQVNKTETDLFNAVLALVPTTPLPVGTLFDSPLSTFPYAFDNLGGQSVKALQLISDVTQSSLGFFFSLKDGTPRYQNRQARSRGASNYSFQDTEITGINVVTDLSKVFNRIRVTDHPRTVGTDNTTVVAQLTGALEVHAGDTITYQVDYRDPTNSLKFIGVTDAHDLVAYTDYQAHTNQDGSGGDLTLSLTVTVVPSASSALFTITNPTAITVWMVDTSGNPVLQLRGAPILDNSPRIYESYTAMNYGDRLLPIDLKYSADPTSDLPQGMADFLGAQYSSPIDQLYGIEFIADRSNALMLQARNREIGDIVDVSETMNGVSSVAVAINGIQMKLTSRKPGPMLTVTYITSPRGPASAWVLDDSSNSQLDDTTTLGFI